MRPAAERSIGSDFLDLLLSCPCGCLLHNVMFIHVCVLVLCVVFFFAFMGHQKRQSVLLLLSLSSVLRLQVGLMDDDL